MYTLDGSRGEGGGSILRLATALSLVIQEPIRIINIRKKRPKSGLKTQHLMGLQALADFCGGNVEGAQLGSETIVFNPSDNFKSHLNIDVSTAGSLGLILQTFQIAVLATKNFTLNINFKGGATFGKWSPSIPYVDNVTWNIFRVMGCDFRLKVVRHGFFPKGGARVSASLTSPSLLKGLSMVNFKEPDMVDIFSYASKYLQKAQVAERQSKVIEKALENKDINITRRNEYVDTNNPGSGILIFSKAEGNIFGGDFVGERKLRAEEVGQNAFKRYNKTINSQSTVDLFLADQILPFMALAKGSSKFTTPYISNHTKTNIQVLEEMLNVEIITEKLKTNFQLSIEV